MLVMERSIVHLDEKEGEDSLYRGMLLWKVPLQIRYYLEGSSLRRFSIFDLFFLFYSVLPEN